MQEEKNYEKWCEARADAQVPDGFADRVMLAVKASDRDTRQTVLGALLPVLFRSKLARVAIYAVAGVACLARIGFLMSPFVVS